MNIINKILRRFGYKLVSIKNENKTNKKLNEDDVRLIRQLSKEGLGYQKIAKKFDVSCYTIRDIIKFRTWTHV